MTRYLWRYAALVGAIALFGTAPPAHASAIVANGGFEVPTVGGGFATYPEGSTALMDWTIEKASINVGLAPTSVDQIGGYWQAAEGNQSIDLDGTPSGPSQPDQSAKISQDVSLVAGQTYELSFALAGNPDNGDDLKKVLVSVGSLTPTEVDFNTSGQSHSNMGWTYHNFLFTAGATNTVTFDSSTPGWFGPALDDVSIVAVPLPATANMGIALIGCLGCFGTWRTLKERQNAMA